MLKNKLLLGLATLLILPVGNAIADSSSSNSDDSEAIYLRLGYNMSFVGNQTIANTRKTIITPSSVPPDGATTGTEHYEAKYGINTVGGNIAIGKSFHNSTRAEIEFGAQSLFKEYGTKADNIDYFADKTNAKTAYSNKGFKLGLFALNAYYDIDSGHENIMPYVGGGVGFAKVNFMSDPTESAISYPVALLFRAGTKININKVMPLYIGYKLVYLMRTDAKPQLKSKFYNPNDVANIKNFTINASYMLHNLDVGFIFSK